jgi:hypothetical protein
VSLHTLYITSYASIDQRGISTPKGHVCWEPDQKNPGDIRRAQVLAAPYVAFGKLNLPDKLAFSAASLALRDGPGGYNNHMGVFLAIPGGSLSTDRAFRDSIEQGNPSPALFSATLPSSPVADIAIYHHLTGPNIVFAGGDSPFISALGYTALQPEMERPRETMVVFIDEPVEAVGMSATPTPLLLPSAVALVLVTEPVPSLASLSFEPLDHDFPAETPSTTDAEFSMALTATLEKCGSMRMPVCAGGFKGYICLNFPRKDC